MPCPDCKPLAEENKKLRKRVEKLEEEVQQLKKLLKEEKRKNKRQAAPFRKDDEDQQEGQKEEDVEEEGQNEGTPGREEGHRGEYRDDPDRQPDRLEQAELPDTCTECGHDLTEEGAVLNRHVHEQYQDHLELLHELIQFNVETGCCAKCGEFLVGTHPERDTNAVGAAGNNLSDDAKALLAHLNKTYGMSLQKLSTFVEENTSTTITEGGIQQMLSRLRDGLSETHDQIKRKAQAAEKVHADETGWRIDGENGWLWVFCNEELSLFTIRKSRAHEVVLEMLGEEYEGLFHSDCYRAYDALEGWTQQKCIRHLVRRAEALEESKTRRAVCFGRDVKELFREAIQLSRSRRQMNELDYNIYCKAIESKMDRILDRNISDPDNARFQRCLDRQRPHLFRFLYEEEAEPTNNRAERDLRPAVIARKLSGCSRSDDGADIYALIKSVCETARKQGEKVLDLLAEAFANDRMGHPVSLLFTGEGGEP